MVTIDNDRKLLISFLRFLGIDNIPHPDSLTLTEQCLPGEATDESSSLTRTGLPDGAIFDDEGWALIIESKVQAKLTRKQLVRHVKTTEARGYKSPHLLAITVDEQTSPPLQDCICVTWRELYAWFSKPANRTEWTSTLVGYRECSSSR